jgi:hypothetical protein
MKEIDEAEAKSFISRVGPHISSTYDLTKWPKYPDTRKDVCVVHRKVSNGASYGYDTLYLVWKPNDNFKYEELANSSSTKDYMWLDEILEDGDDLVIKITNAGTYSGNKWDREFRRSKKRLGLE